MPNRTRAAALAMMLTIGLFGAGAAAGGPPATDGLSGKPAAALLGRLVMANLAVLHCEGLDMDTARWKFITDTAGQLAGEMGLDARGYQDHYLDPALDALDRDGFCTAQETQVPALLEELIGMGGTVEPYEPGR